jgi:2-phosphoglycerate kinase
MELHNSIPPLYWIGGSTCAGKTTISNILSEKFGFTVYHCDEHLRKHIELSNINEHPNLNKAYKISWNEVLSMSVEEYLKWSIGLFTEEFEMILEDLRNLNFNRPALVEGVGIFPGLIYNRIPDVDHAVWVIADEVFYKKHQVERKELLERIKSCSNPEQALNNYLSYDLAMGRYILNDAKMLGLNTIELCNDSDLAKNIETVSKYLKLE